MSKISIIIPIYNALDDVKILLKSLLTNFNFNIGEIILVNDCSLAETTDYLNDFAKEHTNFKLITNEENLGFVKSCNKGMKASTGDIVVLLNSDTKIPSEFCERIIKCFETNQKVGVASPISSHSWLFYISLPKNLTLEQMNERLRKNHKCTYPLIHAAEGFCFCIRKQVIEQQGYLDEIYGKGYHEEVDFAYRAITNGWQNVLIDDLYVYHKRHASFGISEREKQLQKNDAIYLSRWGGFKEKYEKEHNLKNPINKIKREMFPFKTFFSNLFSIKNSYDKRHKIVTILGVKVKINALLINKGKLKRQWQEYFNEFSQNKEATILIIDQRIPEFDKSAGARSTLHIIQTYKELGLNICFLPDNFDPIEPYSQQLRDLGIKLLTDINIDSEKIFKLWLKNYAKNIDYIFLSRPMVCKKYLKEIKKYKNIKILYYGQDLHFLREQRTYEITKNIEHLETSKRLKKIEYEIIQNADVSYFPSVVEKDLLKKDFPAKDIEVIPVYAYATDNLPAPQKFEDRKDILFVGGFLHAPNADGLQWFVKEIFPQIVKVIPDIKLNVAGSNVTDEIRQLESTNINILGFVSDEELQYLYKTTRVVVAPLRYGAGMKGKVIEALYNQIPIITTDIGAEGIENLNNAIAIANEPDGFAHKLIELYSNKDKNEYAANNSLSIIKNQFSKEGLCNILQRGITCKNSQSQ